MRGSTQAPQVLQAPRAPQVPQAPHAKRRACWQALRKALPYVVLFAVFFLMSSYIADYEDDLVFRAGPERYGGFAGWLFYFSQNWGGRVVPQGLLVLILQLPSVVFTAVNAAMWVLLLAYAEKCFAGSSARFAPFVMGAFALAIFGFIPSSVLTWSVFWKCATVLYLWATAFALVALYPAICALRGGKVLARDLVFAAVGCFYAGGFEQVGVFLAVALVLLVAVDSWCCRRIRPSLAALALWAAACTAFFCTLPGNAVRSAIEVLCQYQQYDMFTTVDKLLLGVAYALGNAEREFCAALFCLAVVACVGVRVLKRGSRALFAGCCVAVAYFGICLVNQLGVTHAPTPTEGLGAFALVDVTSTDFGVGKMQMAKEVVNVCFVVFLGAALATLPGDRSGAIVLVCFFGGLATMVIMGFSPTFIASGDRPRFVGYFLLLCVMLQSVLQVVRECVSNQVTDTLMDGSPRGRITQ